jgi:phosphatidylethanolamine/phosphatidyl-N-methylethanolamine N-methyltransferase
MFDTIVAANVIHLLPDPHKALKELERVCRTGGKIIVPTYVNKDAKGKDSLFSKIAAKLGVGFKHQFTFSSYKEFFSEAGFVDVKYTFIEGKIPCALAVISGSTHF